VGEYGSGGCGQEGAGDADHRDGRGGAAESGPAQVHATVEQDAQQRHSHHAFDELFRWGVQVREQRNGDGGRREEHCRRGNVHPFAEPVGQHCQQTDDGGDQHQDGEGLGITHIGAPAASIFASGAFRRV
jgi:hypothetical protein